MITNYFKNIWLWIGGLSAIFLISFSLINSHLAGSIATLIIMVVYGYIAFQNRLYGLILLLAELVVGSKGYLFSLYLPQGRISLRLGLFVILVVIWLFCDFSIAKFKNIYCKLSEFKIYALLIGVLFYGALNGYLRGNGMAAIFFDLNGYLYLGLFPIFISVLDSREKILETLRSVIYSTVFLAIFTLFSAYLFFHKFAYVGSVYYKWLRNAGLAEITRLSPDADFYRLFFQSHLYFLISGVLLFFLIYFLTLKSQRIKYDRMKLVLGLSVIFSGLLISASRSIWLGCVAAGTAAIGSIWFIPQKNIRSLRSAAKGIAIGILPATIIGVVITFMVLNFPVPKPQNIFAFGVLGQRLTISGEAAVNSRWKQLPGLLDKIKEAPILGSGFGTAITYNSDDPRIKNLENPSGQYTTYSFEWGYLDTLIEVGATGLAIILFFIFLIFKNGYLSVKEGSEEDRFLAWGIMIALIGLMATHAVTPYLNHPLGLGYVMLAAAALSLVSRHSTLKTR